MFSLPLDEKMAKHHDVIEKEKVVRDFLTCRGIETSIKLNVPVQIHTGIGESPIINVQKCNPICLYDLLKDGGSLIIAEGIPPSEDKDVVDWYAHMFSFKEKRRTFTPTQLVNYLQHNGFVNVSSFVYVMKNFSIRNWLINSGLNNRLQNKILKLHLEAGEKTKSLYNMKVTKLTIPVPMYPRLIPISCRRKLRQ
jgi:hypothetical protein